MKSWIAAAVDIRSMDSGDDRPEAGHLAFLAFQLTTAAWPELAESGLAALG